MKILKTKLDKMITSSTPTTLTILVEIGPTEYDSHIIIAEIHRRRRRGDRGGVSPPLKFRKKNFGQFLSKIRAFSGKNYRKLGNFVNFSGKYHKNSDILIIFRARIM